ncbi:hypothetical protein FKM82_014248 [Ascaphus truei]
MASFSSLMKNVFCSENVIDVAENLCSVTELCLFVLREEGVVYWIDRICHTLGFLFIGKAWCDDTKCALVKNRVQIQHPLLSDLT